MPAPVRFLQITEALRVFAMAPSTQSQEHIKPLHQHLALRLAVEGGFLPDEITPHPPLKARHTADGWVLEYDAGAKTSGELTVFGGMKTKQIDVVVVKSGIGPVLAVSVKGTVKAYRNLVNRMEEAIGDSTNVHVMYPGLVYGFLHFIRANRETSGYLLNDIGITKGDTISPVINRYFAALSEMTGRRFVRNDYTRYESVGLVLVENDSGIAGSVHGEFPPSNSPLRMESFFSRLFEVYDLRFPSRAEHVAGARRVAWDSKSPFFGELIQSYNQPLEDILGYCPRLGA